LLAIYSGIEQRQNGNLAQNVSIDQCRQEQWASIVDAANDGDRRSLGPGIHARGREIVFTDWNVIFWRSRGWSAVAKERGSGGSKNGDFGRGKHQFQRALEEEKCSAHKRDGHNLQRLFVVPAAAAAATRDRRGSDSNFILGELD
jgi:hypothetical protein